LRPLKFLGMTYDPFRGVFMSSTREGKSLEFTEDKEFLSWLSENRAKLAGSAETTQYSVGSET